MDDRFWLDNHIDVCDRCIEQDRRLNQLKSLIHQGGGIDGNLCPHVPIWMLECLCRGDIPQLLFGEVSERSAAGCEDDPAKIAGVSALQTLPNGTVFA